MTGVDALKFAIPALVIVAVASVLLSGCTTRQISRNVYEGVKNRNGALRSTPPDYTTPRAPSYDDYDRERRDLQAR